MNCLHKFIGRMHIIEFGCKHKYYILNVSCFISFFLGPIGHKMQRMKTSCKLLFHATRQNSATFRLYYLCVWSVHTVHTHTRARTSMCVWARNGAKCQVPGCIRQVLETSSSMLIGSSHFKKSVWTQVSQLMQSRATHFIQTKWSVAWERRFQRESFECCEHNFGFGGRSSVTHCDLINKRCRKKKWKQNGYGAGVKCLCWTRRCCRNMVSHLQSVSGEWKYRKKFRQCQKWSTSLLSCSQKNNNNNIPIFRHW